MPLRFGGTGVVTTYVAVGPDGFSEEEKRVRAAVKRASDMARKRHQDHHPREEFVDPLGRFEVLYLFGQADLATMLEVPDFRHVFDMRYPNADATALVVNSIFSVIYDMPQLRLEPTGSPDERLRFVLHLRYQRNVHAYEQAERKIVDRIVELLDVNRNGARIHAGLGWSDLIIDGFFTRDTFEILIGSIIDIHGLRLQVGMARERIAVFNRMFTVLGYPVSEGLRAPRFSGRRHLMFLRAMPGHYEEIAAALKRAGLPFIMDGKADFVAVSDVATDDFLEGQRKFLTDGKSEGWLQKLETHLMFFRASAFADRPADRLIVAVVKTRRDLDCRCREGADAMRHLLNRTLEELARRNSLAVPEEQRAALDNMLFLLGATLRDVSICCDVSMAVMACYHTLLELLEQIDEVGSAITRLPQEEPTRLDLAQAVREHYAKLVRLWKALDDWRLFAELLLRQRTVGSFEEILGQTDRSVVYSGGVQKFLYLSDQLINEFAGEISKAFAEELGENLAPFATIYDAVKTPVSSYGGLVRIPTLKLFQLPLAVSDLWHEVGVSLFDLWLSRQFESHHFSESDYDKAVESLADHYADLIVYLFGFGGDFERFMFSMADAWTRAHGKDEMHVRGPRLIQFIFRAYLVCEFDRVRTALADGDDKVFDRMVTDPVAAADEVLFVLAKFVRERRDFRPFKKIDIPFAYWELLFQNVCKVDYSLSHRRLYIHLLNYVPPPRRVGVEAFRHGEIMEFGGDENLNEYFGELAYEIQKRGAWTDSYFTMMAALAKSATIEYHRRQVTKPPSPTGSSS